MLISFRTTSRKYILHGSNSPHTIDVSCSIYIYRFRYQAIFYDTIINGDLYRSSNKDRVKKVFDQLEWDQTQVDGLQQAVLNSSFFYCGGTDEVCIMYLPSSA